MRSPETTSWHCASWQAKPAQQQPVYEDPAALQRVVAELSRLPPIVVSWEVEALRERLAAAQRGQAFLLQGGDCAETFADCESDTIVKKLKILLQMSLVLLHGLKKPIIRVGRMAGQYAKPRSVDTETRDGVTLPSFRGDLVNRPEFTAAAREPTRSCCCAATSGRPSRSISRGRWSTAASPTCITRNTGTWASSSTRSSRTPTSASSSRSAMRSISSRA